MSKTISAVQAALVGMVSEIPNQISDTHAEGVGDMDEVADADIPDAMLAAAMPDPEAG